MAREDMSFRYDLSCKVCDRKIPQKCMSCHQFIYATNPINTCSGCGQERLKKVRHPDLEDEQCEQLKDGTYRFRCNCCNRPRDSCPKCRRAIFYDPFSEDNSEESDEDDEENESEDDDDDEDEEEEEEEDEPHAKKRKKKKDEDA